MIGTVSAGGKPFKSFKYKQKEYKVLLQKGPVITFAEQRNRT